MRNTDALHFLTLKTLCCGSLWLDYVAGCSWMSHYELKGKHQTFFRVESHRKYQIHQHFSPIKIHLNQFIRFIFVYFLPGCLLRSEGLPKKSNGPKTYYPFWIHEKGNTSHVNEIQLYLTLSFIFCLSCVI